MSWSSGPFAAGHVPPLLLLLAGSACDNPALPSPPDLGATPAPDLSIAKPPDLTLLAPADLMIAPPDLSPPGRDLASRDLALPAGDLAQGDFFADLSGIWLIGWSGGLNHYTWVRFDVANPNGGRADFLPPMGNGAWIGFWPSCSGQGQWALAARPSTVTLMFPAMCNLPNQSITWKSIGPVLGGWPPTALRQAIMDGVLPAPQDGWKFPPQQCDAPFTKCTLP